MPRVINLNDVQGPVAAADAAAKKGMREAMGFDSTPERVYGTDGSGEITTYHVAASAGGLTVEDVGVGASTLLSPLLNKAAFAPQSLAIASSTATVSFVGATSCILNELEIDDSDADITLVVPQVPSGSEGLFGYPLFVFVTSTGSDPKTLVIDGAHRYATSFPVTLDIPDAGEFILAGMLTPLGVVFTNAFAVELRGA